jgi:glycerate 2-kinase
MDRYRLKGHFPVTVVNHLRDGQSGKLSPKHRNPGNNWRHVHNHIIGSNAQAIAAAREKAVALGYHTLILSTRMEGETRYIAQAHGAIAREVLAGGNPVSPPACLLSGGETTVTIRGNGSGGRNQEFALAAAIDIDGADFTVVLSAGTDGSDGPTDAAGAIADSSTVRRSVAGRIGYRPASGKQ